MSPVTVVRFEFISPPASFSSFSRRPVITTCAPSSTKRLAVAKPIPLLPPVITAIFPANFCPCSSLICFLPCFSLFFYVEFMLFLRSSHSHRLLLLLEQILEDEPTPSLAACMHQRATLVELSQLDGCEPDFFGQIRHGSDSVLVVARQKDDPVAALDDRVGSQCGRNQVIKTLHQLGAGERLRDEGGGRETVQLLRWDWKRVHRVDDRLAFPTRQGLRNLAMVAERNRQDDCVSLECIPQRHVDDRGSNRPGLRCQRLGRPATRDCYVDFVAGEGVGEGLAYLAESYNCVAHISSPICVDVGNDSTAFNDARLSV